MGLFSFIKEALHENDAYEKAARDLVRRKCTLENYKEWARTNAYDEIYALESFYTGSSVIFNHQLYSNVKVVEVTFFYRFTYGSKYYKIQDGPTASRAVSKWLRETMYEITGELSYKFGMRFDYRLKFKEI